MTYNERRLETIELQNKIAKKVKEGIKIGKVSFDIDVEKYKSIIKAGNITIYNPNKFNKLQKWLWKKLLNIEI